jgi:hypothetical protein
LKKSDDSVDEHDAEDDRRIHPFAEKRRHNGCEEKDVNERLVELPKELHPRWRAAVRAKAVWAEFLLAVADFLCRQPGGQIHMEESNNLFGWQFMPGFIFQLFIE